MVGGILWDEMSINEALRWSHFEMRGFEKLPGINDVKNSKIATEVIVFMFTSINENLKLPIAYYFTSPTGSDSRYLLAEKIMKEVVECGVYLTSITFDGHASNPGIF